MWWRDLIMFFPFICFCNISQHIRYFLTCFMNSIVLAFCFVCGAWRFSLLVLPSCDDSASDDTDKSLYSCAVVFGVLASGCKAYIGYALWLMHFDNCFFQSYLFLPFQHLLPLCHLNHQIVLEGDWLLTLVHAVKYVKHFIWSPCYAFCVFA